MTIDIAYGDLVGKAVPASAAHLAAAEALAVHHPDAELIGLAAEYETARQAREAHLAVLLAVEEAYSDPETPRELFARSGDPFSFRPCQRHDGRCWYRNQIEEFRAVPRTYCGVVYNGEVVRRPDPIAQRRADEIVAAFDRWDAACKQARIDSGLEALDEEDDRLYERMWALHDRIVEAVPTTFAGIAAKARASTLRHKLFETGEENESDTALTLSIIRDVVRIGTTAASIETAS
jgi:hypothetical protein